MGNYVFSTDVLVDALEKDAADPDSRHDMGGDIIPMLVEQQQAAVYDFNDNVVPGATDRDRDYWRDVGTLDAYHEAHLDLVSVEPIFNLYNTDWPIFTSHPQLPGAKFVENAFARDTIVCGGSIVSGANVDSSVIGSNVYVGAGAKVERSVIFDNVTIGRGRDRPQRDPRQERDRPRRHGHRGRRRRGPPARLHGQRRRASWRWPRTSSSSPDGMPAGHRRAQHRSRLA